MQNFDHTANRRQSFARFVMVRFAQALRFAAQQDGIEYEGDSLPAAQRLRRHYWLRRRIS